MTTRRLLSGLTVSGVLLLPTVAMAQRVFLSSSTQNGDLGGLSGGDEICQSLADSEVLGGEWIAWLSTETTNAIDRLVSPGPFVLVDNTTIVADDQFDLTNSSIDNPIDLDESGTQIVDEFDVAWTGTSEFGLSVPGLHCSSWTVGTNTENQGRVGSPTATNFGWTNFGSSGCNSLQRLYCFENEEPVPTFPRVYWLLLAVLGLLALGVRSLRMVRAR